MEQIDCQEVPSEASSSLACAVRSQAYHLPTVPLASLDEFERLIAEDMPVPTALSEPEFKWLTSKLRFALNCTCEHTCKENDSRQQVGCSLCDEPKWAVVKLGCRHTSCYDCLSKTIVYSRSHGAQPHCPFCRTEICVARFVNLEDSYFAPDHPTEQPDDGQDPTEYPVKRILGTVRMGEKLLYKVSWETGAITHESLSNLSNAMDEVRKYRLWVLGKIVQRDRGRLQFLESFIQDVSPPDDYFGVPDDLLHEPIDVVNVPDPVVQVLDPVVHVPDDYINDPTFEMDLDDEVVARIWSVPRRITRSHNRGILNAQHEVIQIEDEIEVITID